MSRKQEPKEDKFDATGQIAGGYDLGMARGFCLEHAKKTVGEYVGEGEDRRPLIWKIERAGWDEDADCWEVVLSAEPERAQVEQKGIWVYHVRPVGGLLPGTPLLRQSLLYNVPPPSAPPGIPYPTPRVVTPAQPPTAAARAAPPTPAAMPPLPRVPTPSTMPAPAPAIAAPPRVAPGLLLAGGGTAIFVLTLFLVGNAYTLFGWRVYVAVSWGIYLALLLGIVGFAADVLGSRFRAVSSPSLGLFFGMLVTLWLFTGPLRYEFGLDFYGVNELNPFSRALMQGYSVYDAVLLKMPPFYAAMGTAMALSYYSTTRKHKWAILVGATAFLMAWVVSIAMVWLIYNSGWKSAILVSPLLVVSYAAPAFLFVRRPR